MSETRPTTGLHGLSLTVWESFVDQETVDFVLKELFNLSLADFHNTSKKKGNKRAYDSVLSYKNQIFAYYGGRTQNNKDTVHLEIKGGYFDSGDADEKKIKSFCINNTVKASALDAYNDDAGEQLSFNRLWKQMSEYYFTSRHKLSSYPGSSPGTGRSIYFGTGAQVLCIYEKGVKHTNEGKLDYPLEWIRLEMKLLHDYADAAFKRWLAGEEVGPLVSGLIAGHVEFKDLKDADRNNSRRRICPYWEKYLAGVEVHKLEVARKPPDLKRQQAAFGQYVNRRCIELGATAVALEAAPVLKEHFGYNPKTVALLEQLIEILRQEELEAL